MATHYETTTKTYTVKDTYGSYWLQAYLTVTVDGSGNGSWSLSMTNDTGGRSVGSLVFSINGSMIHDLYYDGSYNPSASSSPYTRSYGFPIRDDSTASGTFKVSGGSFLIGLAVCRSQAAVTYDTDTNRKRLVNGTAARIGTEKPSGGKDWQAYHVTFSRTYWTDVGVGKIKSFTDHCNNTYSVSGECGAKGTNNAVKSAKLFYGTGKASGSYSTKAFDSGKTTCSAGPIAVTPTTAAERTIYVAVQTTGNKSSTPSDTGWIEKKIRQYLPPTNPTSITLDNSSLRNDRLTIKQDWKYNWSGASRINASCPIKGYRYCLEKQSAGTTTWTKVALKNSSGNALSGKMSGSNEYDTTSTSATFSPSQSGIVAGDKVRFHVKAFTKYGYNNDGTILANGSYATSAESTVQNAGVMQVCVKKGTKPQWVEGVVHVYVKKNNKLQWVEADIVKVYKSKAWKEST